MEMRPPDATEVPIGVIVARLQSAIGDQAVRIAMLEAENQVLKARLVGAGNGVPTLDERLDDEIAAKREREDARK
jgi:hypothetical protein